MGSGMRYWSDSTLCVF